MLRPLLVCFGALTALTGLAYPVALTLFARAAFPRQAEGSLIRLGGQVRASTLIGQPTEDPLAFWGRPSATAGFPGNAQASGGSCLAPSNPALEAAVSRRIAALKASDPGNAQPIPPDLLTASASGLDPEISLAAARWQADRVARRTGLAPHRIEALIREHSVQTLSGARVNVPSLNAALLREGGR